jgi:RNA polymerase sigma-70 factor (ECF subfamily)
LVERSLAGDGDAFAALYRRHVGAVHRVIADSVHDREAVADLVQEVFARAIEALGSLREHDRFRPWLLSIARHAAIDHARTRRVTPATQLGADQQDEVEAPDPEPDELAAVALLGQRVRRCVAGLSARDVTVLSLVTTFGCTPSEVALALGITPGAAKVVVHRARRRLRSALALELLAEHQAEACPVFRDAFERGRLTEAGNHIATCACCRSAVNGDVELFAHSSRSSSPTTLIPARSSSAASASANPPTLTTPNPATSSL